MTSRGLRAAVRALFRREYTHVQAVTDLSFTLAAGERVALVVRREVASAARVAVSSPSKIGRPDSSTCRLPRTVSVSSGMSCSTMVRIGPRWRCGKLGNGPIQQVN